MVEIGDILQFKPGCMEPVWDNVPAIIIEIIRDDVRVRYQDVGRPTHGTFRINVKELNKYFGIENKLWR